MSGSAEFLGQINDMFFEIGSQLITQFHEVYVLDCNGDPIDHTAENHKALTFLDFDEALAKANNLAALGINVEIHTIG